MVGAVDGMAIGHDGWLGGVGSGGWCDWCGAGWQLYGFVKHVAVG